MFTSSLHGPEDDARLAGTGNERHLASCSGGEQPKWRTLYAGQWLWKWDRRREGMRNEPLEHELVYIAFMEMELAGCYRLLDPALMFLVCHYEEDQ